MLRQVLIAALLLTMTTFVHAWGMSVGLAWVRSHLKGGRFRFLPQRKATPIVILVLVMFLASVVEAFLWAVTYVLIGAVEGIGKAMYFSTVTYTTLGYGDVTLAEHWRLLSAFEAANGVIMFGWSTALVAAAVQRVYFPSVPAAEE